MKKNSKNIYQEVEEFFKESPTANQKAWGLINHFYHLILTYMEMNNIKQADLAKKLGKSRSAISQLFKQTPNISIKKMVEIADAIGINLNIESPEVEFPIMGKFAKLEIPLNKYGNLWVNTFNEPSNIEQISGVPSKFENDNLLIDYV
jgi:transcriptional regulator with XRE-family HTH domain